MIKPLLAQLATGEPFTEAQAVDAFEALMSGEISPVQAGAMLALIQLRGPTVDELVGAARVMRAKAVRVEAPANLRLI
ncbi:MAG: anthranilate phosphoribosyltransferase, partial [Rhodospirillales bacterium]|nr:anthranilate phosphoribosyltransferase [Rhodospirillales bacterium]